MCHLPEERDMVKAHSAALAIVSTLASSLPALAQDSELGRVREEMKQLQRNYEERMQALEKRLTDAESRAARAEKSATQAEQNASHAGRSPRPAAPTAEAGSR